MICLQPADVLGIHLSRSTQYTRGGLAIKNSCLVSFPEFLAIDPFCTTGQLDLRTKSRPAFIPLNCSDASSNTPASRAKHLYRLSSVVVHFGSHSFGHYITFRRRPGSRDDWLRISDETVDAATFRQVSNANPFLLFYTRVDSRRCKEPMSSELDRTVKGARLFSRSTFSASSDEASLP